MQTFTHSIASNAVMRVCVCSVTAGTFGTNSSSELRVDGKVNGALSPEMLPGGGWLNG